MILYGPLLKPSLLFVALALIVSCRPSPSNTYSIEVFQTTQSDGYLKELGAINPKKEDTAQLKLTLTLLPEDLHQELIGFGASFTESSAWNLATLPEEARKEILVKLFSPTDGAGFSLCRTHINSCDYSNGHYSYVDEGDESLESFSLFEDLRGFTGAENDQVKGIELIHPDYDLIPMILESAAVPAADFKIIASPWSPPSWMKSEETSEMTNGTLLPQYYSTWAHYLSKYISAYQEQGITIWGITPQNEPLHAQHARWESNGFTPVQGRDFLSQHLGPQLVKDGHLDTTDLEAGLKVLIYDHNKSSMLDYVSPTYQDPEAAKYAWGTGFHWYASSGLEKKNWFADDLKKHRELWPNKGMIHTESSIDIDPKDPIGQYWRLSPDYAGVFIPFDTYANDIITDLNCGTQGYIEWCMILSTEGQPNPYDNFNSAPVLVNPQSHEIIYTPLYYLLSHFSKFIRPGAQRIGFQAEDSPGLNYTAVKNSDGSIIVVIFNGNEASCELSIELAETRISLDLPARAMQTIRLRASH